MSILTISGINREKYLFSTVKTKRIASIDLLRGVVMIVMALDHVRDYFHRDAFFYSPTDLTKTSAFLFFTRFITHYCAPVFVFLAGISAYLYGTKKSKRELTFYLFTRGMWMVFTELFIISLCRTFNPSYPVFNLQVIWAIGISMMALSAIIYLKPQWILAIAVLLIAGHNLLDNVHVPAGGFVSFLWSVLHEPKDFIVGHFTILVTYPVIPWIGIISLGYYFGSLYNPSYDEDKRRRTMFYLGIAMIFAFFLLRIINVYGDASHWTSQENITFFFLSLLNVSKYPPSLLYTLITLGPAFIFLALAEEPLNSFTERIAVFGRVPFFYYVLHVFVIHIFAMIGAMMLGYDWSVMILNNKVNNIKSLQGYGFDLAIVYFVWIGLIILLYPLCKWFDKYKRKYQSARSWLSYV